MPAAIAPHPVHIQPPVLSAWQHGPAPYVQERQAAQPGPEVLLTALVHGNEYAGAIVLDELLRSGLVPQRGRITAAFVNISAFARFDAAQPDHSRFVDQDLNRVWSLALLDSEQTSSELARAREIRPFVQRATHLLDLHSMHEPCEPLLITGLLPHHVAFAQSLGGCGQVVMDAGHQDGVRLRDFADFGLAHSEKVALLLEAGQHWSRASLAAARDVLMRFLLRSGAITLAQVQAHGLQAWLAPERSAPTPLRVTHAIVARSLDFAFTTAYQGNEVIAKAGTVIAHDAGLPITTPYDDCVLVMPSVRQLRPGVTTVRLGQRVAEVHAAMA
jgi:predicted deacylase